MSKNDIKKCRLSFFFNIVIVVFVIIATVIMCTGVEFMKNKYAPVLTASKISMFKYFTVDSNIFMGIASLIFMIYEDKLLRKKIESIPKGVYLLKLVATSAVSVTFFVVLFYLGPISKGGLMSMFVNSNLFYHLIIPVFSIITFIAYEKTDKLKIKDTLCGIIPTIIYGFYYLINILLHIENGKVTPVYDWYYFIQNGVWTAVIVTPIMFIISYIICFMLWDLNKIGKK